MKTFFKPFAFLVFLSIVSFSCKKDEIEVEFEPEETTVKSPSQFSAMMDGKPVFFKVEKTEDFEIYSDYVGVGYYPGFTGSARLGSKLERINPDSTITPLITITKGTLNYGSGYTLQSFKNFFGEGTYQYSMNASNGFMIEFWDADGVHWSTSKGDAIQLTKNFKIIESVGSFPNNVEHVRIKAEFSCFLYDDDDHIIELTDGVFIGTFKNI